ncbi:MAG TPA: response regulator transcription factor [Rhodocyclaceae bacterium]|nr:response regulator transcription factor [Rhodocyclaceae bacterium]
MAKLLIADDDVELCALLHSYLGAEGFDVHTVHDGQDALERATAEAFDLVILDVMMPGKDGFEVLAQLRRRQLTPVLMLTARGEDADSITGLELGADDYLAKPCNPQVLVARIRAILRRAEPAAAVDAVPALQLTVGDLSLNRQRRELHKDGTPLALTSTEFSVVEVLLRDAGQIVSKEQLSREALGRELGRYDRALDMHISNLRHKLGPLADGGERILTVRGSGYQYVIAAAPGAKA